MRVPSQDQEDPLEEDMATHSSILAWRIPWTEEPGGLQSMGLQQQDMTEVTWNSTANNATMNIKGDISFQISVFLFFGYNSRSGIAGSHGTPIFNILRKIYTVFHSGCINLYSIGVLEFPFLHILVNNYLSSFLFTYLFIYYYFDRCEVISHCDFIFYRLSLLIY